MRGVGLLFSGLAALGLVGCAPDASDAHRPVAGAHQTVTVGTEPAGATCLLTAGAEPLAEVLATPALVRLPQSGRDVRVFCALPGRAPVASFLPAVTEGRKVAAAVLLHGVGPAAFGTLIGANRSYAPRLDVTLPPMRFATAEERERFFAARADETRRHFDQPIKANKSMCRPDEFGCQHMIAEMERSRDEELARLEKLREATPASERMATR